MRTTGRNLAWSPPSSTSPWTRPGSAWTSPLPDRTADRRMAVLGLGRASRQKTSSEPNQSHCTAERNSSHGYLATLGTRPHRTQSRRQSRERLPKPVRPRDHVRAPPLTSQTIVHEALPVGRNPVFLDAHTNSAEEIVTNRNSPARNLDNERWTTQRRSCVTAMAYD